MSMVMNEKIKCEVCNIEINGAFIDKHNKTKSHIRLLENDLLIITIKNGTNKTKEEWIENFKIIGINVPKYVIDYDFNKPTKEQTYYKNHKEEILEKQKVNIICECGKKIRKKSKSKHIESKKHLKYLEMQK